MIVSAIAVRKLPRSVLEIMIATYDGQTKQLLSTLAKGENFVVGMIAYMQIEIETVTVAFTPQG